MSGLVSIEVPQAFEDTRAMATNRRNVKSDGQTSVTTDGHERGKTFPTAAEVERLLTAARLRRHGARNHLMLLMTYRHGLRASELVEMPRAALDLQRSRLCVERAKCC